MKLESAAVSGKPAEWDLEFVSDGGSMVLSTRALVRRAFGELSARRGDTDPGEIADIAASFQFNLARGIATLAIRAAEERGIDRIALSGGVAYNRAIRSAIGGAVRESGHQLIINTEYPLGDGCVSFGQCITAGLLANL
jgi:hydrogenase maturation protein HypF